MTVRELLVKAKQAYGKTFYGYKGGDFLMDKNTPIYCCQQQNYSSLQRRECNVIIDAKWKISGIAIKDGKAYIKTSICDVYENKEDIISEFHKLINQ